MKVVHSLMKFVHHSIPNKPKVSSGTFLSLLCCRRSGSLKVVREFLQISAMRTQTEKLTSIYWINCSIIFLLELLHRFCSQMHYGRLAAAYTDTLHHEPVLLVRGQSPLQSWETTTCVAIARWRELCIWPLWKQWSLLRVRRQLIFFQDLLLAEQTVIPTTCDATTSRSSFDVN